MADDRGMAIPFVMTRPPKPWADMTDDERESFALALVDALAEMDAVAQATINAELHEPGVDYTADDPTIEIAGEIVPRELALSEAAGEEGWAYDDDPEYAKLLEAMAERPEDFDA